MLLIFILCRFTLTLSSLALYQCVHMNNWRANYRRKIDSLDLDLKT